MQSFTTHASSLFPKVNPQDVHMNVHVFHFAHVKNSLLTKSFNIIRLA